MGLKTRFDGRVVTSKACRDAVKGRICIPVCPEQLGGLPTPRVAADLIGGNGYDVLDDKARVITKSGTDVTDKFILGATQVLKIAQRHDVATVFFKSRSPSCGLSPHIGVTAALLVAEGYRVVEME
jgi:uncharacterized protein YbbK (DUF523 family)